MRKFFFFILFALAISAVATRCANFVEHAKAQRAQQISQVTE